MNMHKLILEKDIQSGNMTLLNKDYLKSKAKQKKQMQAGHKCTDEPLPH